MFVAYLKNDRATVSAAIAALGYFTVVVDVNFPCVPNEPDGKHVLRRRVRPIGTGGLDRVASEGAYPPRRHPGWLARGMNPGTPVLTTWLKRTLFVTPSRSSCMASSGKVEISKFSWIW